MGKNILNISVVRSTVLGVRIVLLYLFFDRKQKYALKLQIFCLWLSVFDYFSLDLRQRENPFVGSA